MTVLGTNVVRDETFARREAAMGALVAELRERTALVARGGGEKSLERHRSRGKLPARERCRSIACSPPPRATSAVRSRSSATSPSIRSRRAAKASDSRSTWEVRTATG